MLLVIGQVVQVSNKNYTQQCLLVFLIYHHLKGPWIVMPWQEWVFNQTKVTVTDN